MNNPDNYFPELNIPFLKHFVRYQIIKKKFDSLPLKRVVLYRYFSEHFLDVATKYVISFKLGIDRDKLDEDQRKKVENLDILGRQTVFDKDYLHHYWGLDDPFRAVYRNGPPSEDFLIEWLLLVKTSDKEMPLGVMIEPYVMLYDASEKKGQGQDEKKKKKLRPCQKDRLAVRKIAKDIIKKEPNITKIALSRREELLDVISRQYEERTFYDWIKDLLPNRKGGRPPKKSPAVNSQKQAGQKYTLRKSVNNK